MMGEQSETKQENPSAELTRVPTFTLGIEPPPLLTVPPQPGVTHELERVMVPQRQTEIQELELPIQTEITTEPGPTLTPRPEPEPEIGPETEPEAQPETEPEAQPETNSEQGHTQESSDENLPCRDLLADDRRGEFIQLCVPLYKASIKGDWEAAEVILEAHSHLVRYAITENCETPLHVAASSEMNAKTIEFVKNLVCKMQEKDFVLRNKSGETALSVAATAGNVEIAKIMVKHNDTLPSIPHHKNKMMPLYIAALFRNLGMVTYLYEESKQMNGEGWTAQYRSWVFEKCVEAEFFDFALKIIEDHPNIAEFGHGLAALAGKPCAFREIKPNLFSKFANSVTCGKVGSAVRESKALELLRKIWTSIEQKPKGKIDTILRGPVTKIDGKDTNPSRILFVAAEKGNTNFLVELINKYPDLIWKQNDEGQSIFHVAVSHRHVSIYNLLHETGSMKALIYPMKDKQGNNMLHLAGNIARCLEDVSGVAFQMQRELLWFKEVQSMVPPYYTERRNIQGKTPPELFAESHKDLTSEGEKWMKGTASKSMVVAALIATIVFGVAYTIPGAYDQISGFPKFRHKATFIVFVIIDAISLVLSSTSILFFLSILTSRYAQDDFIKSLPRKLIFGLSMLFLSIVTMMIAFSVSFFVLYDHKFYYFVAGCISLLALVPMVSYAILHFPLLKYIFHSTYGSKSLFKPKKQMLYYTNPSV